MANEAAGSGSEQTGGCEGTGAEGLPGGAVVPCSCLQNIPEQCSAGDRTEQEGVPGTIPRPWCASLSGHIDGPQLELEAGRRWGNAVGYCGPLYEVCVCIRDIKLPPLINGDTETWLAFDPCLGKERWAHLDIT